MTLIVIAIDPTMSALHAVTEIDSKIDSPGTPPKNCVTAKTGRVERRSAMMKKSRPSRLPRTICNAFSGEVRRMSHVLAFASYKLD